MKLRARVMVVGGILGALVGVGAAYVFMRVNPVEIDEEGRERLPAVQPAKVISVGLGLLTVARQLMGISLPEEAGKGRGRRG